LPGVAFRGKNWAKTHRPVLLQKLAAAFATEHVIGVCLNEVGNLSDPIGEVGKYELELVLRTAYRASAAEHEDLQIFWPPDGDETVSAWKHGIKVEALKPLKGFLAKDHAYRTSTLPQDIGAQSGHPEKTKLAVRPLPPASPARPALSPAAKHIRRPPRP
jgi:hypothetical protein